MTKENCKNLYDFDCELFSDDNYDGVDLWEVFLWHPNNKIGAEYNLCIDGDNYSAIYLFTTSEGGLINTHHDIYKHYEIDFSDSDWDIKLRDEMIKFVEEKRNEA